MENNINRQILDPQKKMKIVDRKAPLQESIKTESPDPERPGRIEYPDIVLRLLGKNMISKAEENAPQALQKPEKVIGKLKNSPQNDRLKLARRTEVKQNNAPAKRASSWLPTGRH